MSILRIGIAGLGTVGSGVLRILSDMPDISVTAVSARHKSKQRDLDKGAAVWVDNLKIWLLVMMWMWWLR